MKKWEVVLRHKISGIRCIVLNVFAEGSNDAVTIAKCQLGAPNSWEFEAITEVMPV